MHPRSEIFSKDPLPEDFEIGDSPTPATNGFHAGLVTGLEWALGRAFALDLSVMADYLRVGETDLAPVAPALRPVNVQLGCPPRGDLVRRGPGPGLAA